MFLEIKIELVTSNCTPLQWGQQVYFHSGECQQALTVTKELHLAASAISRARNPPVILPLPPAPTAAPGGTLIKCHPRKRAEQIKSCWRRP